MNKSKFYESINENTDFNEDFLKKVYGYSVGDSTFLIEVSKKLWSIGKKEIIIAYNEWFGNWKKKQDEVMKDVAAWYQKECERNFEKLRNERKERAVSECKQILQEMSDRELLILLGSLAKEE